jgi:hypothetical protein
VDPLVAQAEDLGDLPHRRPGRVQPPDGMVVIDSRPLGLVLELEQPIAGLPRLTNEPASAFSGRARTTAIAGRSGTGLSAARTPPGRLPR